MTRLGFVAVCICVISMAYAQDNPAVTFGESPGKITIQIGEKNFAVYVYEDPAIPRPYFCQVMAPNGVQVTRNHPPDPAKDADNLDHPDFHPGVWLAFGDLGGADFWRNKARMRHVKFLNPPQAGPMGQFTVLNAYETMDTPPKTICEETCTYTIRPLDEAWFLTSDSQFLTTVDGVAFGDQEEMGFGVRMSTELSVKHGSGTILNNLGGVDQKGTWGKKADWCNYSGIMNNQRTGLMLLADPRNFRPSWFHNRDYGLMVANPFGKKAMTAPEDDTVPPDKTPLPKDVVFRLGFGICVFSTQNDQPPDFLKLNIEYLNLIGVKR